VVEEGVGRQGHADVPVGRDNAALDDLARVHELRLDRELDEPGPDLQHPRAQEAGDRGDLAVVSNEGPDAI
jgi:hypothetical protein